MSFCSSAFMSVSDGYRFDPTILSVAFKFNWRSVSELFGVMFQEYLAYATSTCADQKTVPRRFNYFIGNEVKVVNLENPFNLGEESSQEPEVSACHPYEAGDDLRDEFFIGKRNARGSPALLE